MFALSGEKKPDRPTRKAIHILDDFEKTEYISSFDDSGMEGPLCSFGCLLIFK